MLDDMDRTGKWAIKFVNVILLMLYNVTTGSKSRPEGNWNDLCGAVLSSSMVFQFFKERWWMLKFKYVSLSMHT